VNEYDCKSEPSDIVTINSNASPQKPTIMVSGNTYLCEGDSVYLSAQRVPYGYRWSNGDQGSRIIVKTAGIYSLNITNGFGCKSPESDDIVVLFYPKPEKPRIIEADMKFLECPINAEDYFWYLDHKFIGINSRVINPSDYGNGQYSVMIANNECVSDTSDEYNFGYKTGIQEVKSNEDIMLYPNPNNGSFYINFNNYVLTGGNLEIFNETGKLIYTKQIPKDLKKLKINLSNEGDGTCLLVYTVTTYKITKKFTIKKK